jgi:hypothetical protein
VPDLMAVIDGKPVPLEACGWFQREKCGCIVAALVAAPNATTVYASAEQAHQHITPNRRSRDKEIREGCTWELMLMDDYRGNIGTNWECSQHSTPPGEPCRCGLPIPAGRTAYCSDACRLADKDHGPETDGGDES